MWETLVCRDTQHNTLIPMEQDKSLIAKADKSHWRISTILCNFLFCVAMFLMATSETSSHFFLDQTHSTLGLLRLSVEHGDENLKQFVYIINNIISGCKISIKVQHIENKRHFTRNNFYSFFSYLKCLKIIFWFYFTKAAIITPKMPILNVLKWYWRFYCCSDLQVEHINHL